MVRPQRAVLGFTLLTLVLAATSASARIKVIKRPAPAVGPDQVVEYRWVSSWGVRGDPPDRYPLGFTTHASQAAAVAAAEAHMARSARNGDWAVTHYRIVGEPVVKPRKSANRAGQARSLIDRVRQAKDAVDEAKQVARGEKLPLQPAERELGDTVEEYLDVLKTSMQRAINAKRDLRGRVVSETDAAFRQANAMVDRYNAQLLDLRSVMGPRAAPGFYTIGRARATPPKPPEPAPKPKPAPRAEPPESSNAPAGLAFGAPYLWYSQYDGHSGYVFADNGRAAVIGSVRAQARGSNESAERPRAISVARQRYREAQNGGGYPWSLRSDGVIQIDTGRGKPILLKPVSGGRALHLCFEYGGKVERLGSKEFARR